VLGVDDRCTGQEAGKNSKDVRRRIVRVYEVDAVATDVAAETEESAETPTSTKVPLPHPLLDGPIDLCAGMKEAADMARYAARTQSLEQVQDNPLKSANIQSSN
jgi:hypothetical protein